MNKIKINTHLKNYFVYIGDDLIINLNRILKKENFKCQKYLLVVDKNINFKYINIIKKNLKSSNILTLKFISNEKNKNFNNVHKIIDVLLKEKFSRNDCIINIGGGVLGDLACFAASIFKRGMKFINIPSTLLAQVDASIGGKTGVNHKKFGKNLIGTFYQPDLVIVDVSLLKSLKKKDLLCGYAEIFKHSLISGKKNFNYLERNFKKILLLKKPQILTAVKWSCSIKKEIIEKDEKEDGLRKTLNLGHTFGHAYEAGAGFKKNLNHGEGVILGIKTAIKFSLKEKLISKKEFNIINNHIEKLGFNLNLNKYFRLKDVNKILSFMKNDKKNSTDNINLVLLQSIGKPIINKSYKSNFIKKFFIKELNNI